MNRFITIEGVEGAGKTTQATRLADSLRRDALEIVLTREPGGTELGRRLRRMLLDQTSLGPTAETELLLYLADRAEHVRRLITPALARNAVVICDRYSDSTIAYQGFGRGIPVDTVRMLDALARGDVVPSLTFLLDLPPDEGIERLRATRAVDRIEQETLDFHRRVRDGFLRIARSEPSRVVVVDARQDVVTIARCIAEEARTRLRDTR
jgi:dTMP kinase